MTGNPYYDLYRVRGHSYDELEHYGVLGMKWGIRRYQPYPKGMHGTFLGQSRDEEIRIKKGTEAYRLQSGKELRKGQTYISFDKIDHLSYLGITAAGNGGLSVDMYNKNDKGDLVGNPYSIRMVLSEDIIAPSYQTTMDAFVETMGKVKMKDISPNPKKWEKQGDKEFLKNVKRLNIDECRDKAYLDFVRRFMQDSRAKKMFFEILKSKGYNALIDENDARLGQEGYMRAPMILFDSSSVKVSDAKRITEKEAKLFSELYWTGDYSLLKNSKDLKKWEKWAGKRIDDIF